MCLITFLRHIWKKPTSSEVWLPKSYTKSAGRKTRVLVWCPKRCRLFQPLAAKPGPTTEIPFDNPWAQYSSTILHHFSDVTTIAAAVRIEIIGEDNLGNVIEVVLKLIIPGKSVHFPSPPCPLAKLAYCCPCYKLLVGFLKLGDAWLSRKFQKYRNNWTSSC